jgi:hypothetical protein
MHLNILHYERNSKDPNLCTYHYEKGRYNAADISSNITSKSTDMHDSAAKMFMSREFVRNRNRPDFHRERNLALLY